MFTVYFDDSGTAPDSRVAIASALVIPGAKIPHLEREWETFRKKEDFSYFHSSAAAAHNVKEGFGNWSATKTERVFARVRQIAKKYSIGPQGAGAFAVNKTEYDAVVPAKLKKSLGGHHYTFAVGEMLTTLQKWTEGKRVEYIFDWIEPHEPSRKEIEGVLSRREIRTYAFRSKKDIPGLQCVDQIAWACNLHARAQFFGNTPTALSETAYNDYGGPLENGWLRALTLRKPGLQEYVNRRLEK